MCSAPSKCLVFGEVIDKGGTPYSADIRGVLKGFAEALNKKKGYTLNAANEIEGFLFKGSDAERVYHETASSNTSTPADTTIPCPATRCAPSSTPPPSAAARWVSRMKKITLKLRLRNSKI